MGPMKRSEHTPKVVEVECKVVTVSFWIRLEQLALRRHCFLGRRGGITKELTAIEEQLGQEQILIQKFKMYAGMTQDQQLKACCEQIASKHEIHKNKLLNLLA